MKAIEIALPDEKLERLVEVAARREREPQTMLEAYVDYLLAGGTPVEDTDDVPTAVLQRLAELGGSFDWLKDEPNLYTVDDGEPYG